MIASRHNASNFWNILKDNRGGNKYAKGSSTVRRKAKKVFATDDPQLVIVDYKDDATAFNGEKKGTILGKGVVK